jgi:hypothetical protein
MSAGAGRKKMLDNLDGSLQLTRGHADLQRSSRELVELPSLSEWVVGHC